MKLFLACVPVVLSLAACAEQPTSTSGDNEINVAGTKEQQQIPREENMFKRQGEAVKFRLETAIPSQRQGVWAESLVPDNFRDGRTCIECDYTAVHHADNFQDRVEFYSSGSLMCQVTFTPAGLSKNSCPDGFIVPNEKTQLHESI